MYDENMVQPMRDELTRIGFVEMRSAKDVDRLLGESENTSLVVVNSVCGCSAGACRPGVALALRNAKKPVNLYTVFAGQDREATEQARTYFTDQPPSSPAIVLMRGGRLVYMIHRHDIEGSSPQELADHLIAAFDKYC